MPMIPPANWRRAERESHTKSPMKNKKGRKDKRSSSTLEEAPTPVMATWWALKSEVSEVSSSTVGIWLV